MAIERPKLQLHRGSTYVFDVSDPTLGSHPLKFTADSGTTEYTTGITAAGNSGTVNATVTFDVPSNAPDNLMYYCGSHGLGMGNKIKILPDPSPIVYRNGGDRGFVFAGRKWPASYNSTTGSNNVSYVGIQYFNTTSPGNASSFGSLDAGSVNADGYPGSSNSWCDNAAGNMSNGTRALFGAGNNYQSLTYNDYIQYITCATFSSVAIFGQLTRGGYGKGGTSDGIKALMSDGGDRKQIDYVTIDTTGNASDFGDMQAYSSRGAGFSDGIKCVWNCGQSASYGYEYVTAATLSNAVTFGNPVQSRYQANCAHGNTTYGMTMGGDTNGSTPISSIEYITFQTLGNASGWGSNLPQTRKNNAGCGNSNTAFSCGGEDANGNGYLEQIYAISMDVVGNSASDFGDLAVDHQSGVGNSGNAA